MLVSGDADLDVQIAGRTAALAGMPAARQTDPLAVGDPGRHVDAQRALTHDAAAPVTGLAGAFRNPALARAGVTRGGAHDLPERRARDHLQHASAATALAGCDRRAGRGAVPGAGRALVDRVERDLHRCA